MECYKQNLVLCLSTRALVLGNIPQNDRMRKVMDTILTWVVAGSVLVPVLVLMFLTSRNLLSLKGISDKLEVTAEIMKGISNEQGAQMEALSATAENLKGTAVNLSATAENLKGIAEILKGISDKQDAQMETLKTISVNLNEAVQGLRQISPSYA